MKSRLRLVVWRLPLVALALAQTAAAQDTVSGPVLNRVFDQRTRLLVPVYGIARSAHIGTPLLTYESFRVARVAPDGASALAFLDGVVRISFRGEPTKTPIESSLSSVDRITFSPDGRIAALYSRNAGTIEVIQDWESESVSRQALSLSSIVGALTELAVSDDGRLLIASVTGASSLLYASDSDGLLSHIGYFGPKLAMAFLPGSSEAYVADHDRDEVLKVEARPGGEIRSLMSAQEGLFRPTAIGSSADGSLAIVVSRRSQSVIAISGRQDPEFPPVAIECNCVPEMVLPLSQEGLFQITSFPFSPMVIVDSRGIKDRREFCLTLVPPLDPRPLRELALPLRARSLHKGERLRLLYDGVRRADTDRSR